MKRDLALRLATAAVALAVIIPVLLWGGVIGAQVVVAIAAGLGLWEYAGMEDPPGTPSQRIFAIVLGVLPIAASPWGDQWWVASITCAALAVPVSAVITPTQDLRNAGMRLTATLFAVIYVGLLMSFIPALRALNPERAYVGLHWLTMVLAAVWMGDTGAYLIGSWIGKHKLAPNISPNKSWEGAVGGLVFSAIFGPLLSTGVLHLIFHTSPVPVVHLVIASAIAGVFGQLGDLAESLLKRGAGVKDSGGLFPGHGGMLDRLDSLLFAFPAVYFYARYIAAI